MRYFIDRILGPFELYEVDVNRAYVHTGYRFGDWIIYGPSQHRYDYDYGDIEINKSEYDFILDNPKLFFDV